jgi:hypothetical protein
LRRQDWKAAADAERRLLAAEAAMDAEAEEEKSPAAATAAAAPRSPSSEVGYSYTRSNKVANRYVRISGGGRCVRIDGFVCGSL